MEAVRLSFWIILTSLAILSPSLIKADHGHINDTHGFELDEYWQQRGKEAKIAALDAYHPNPHEVTNDLNLHVHKALNGRTNNSRSLMKRYSGPCLATNPIDKCWRCRNDWAENRKRLADCVLGFGRKTTGGKNGKYYIVFNGSDDAVNPTPGTLRHAVIQDEPLWIIFNRSMIISLQQELMVTSNKTIDGRGANVRIAYGAGITLQYAHNIIIHNIHIHDIFNFSGGAPIIQSVNHVGVRGKTDGDGISIFGSSNIWLDHLSMARCHDGLIDAIMGSTGITISNGHFTEHNDVMLFGGNDNHHDIDTVMQITVAFNHFGRGLVQRMPRCRSGFFHVVNNDYYTWAIYAVGGSANPTIVSQGNRFIPSNNKSSKEVTRREETPQEVWKDWNWSSEGDMFVNGAYFVESGNKLDKKMYGEMNLIKAKSGEYASIITHFTGTIVCKPGQKC